MRVTSLIFLMYQKVAAELSYFAPKRASKIFFFNVKKIDEIHPLGLCF